MAHDDVELLAVGGGPSNLALAVAIDEVAPPELARRSLVIERDDDISWQRGMLLPEALSQVSFLKDLVTLRNPRSKYSFINYLHSVGRLNDFVNMGSFVPYRIELSRYFQWAADSLTNVRLSCGRECRRIQPRRAPDGSVAGWLATLADGDTIGCRHLVIGAGRDANVPAEFNGVDADKVIHSTQYTGRIAKLRKDFSYRVAVVGGAQSAAEMFGAVQRDLPNSRPTMIMRSIGLNTYESSKFTNELYYPSFVDEFFSAQPDARKQLLAEMHRTNYAGLAPGTLESLYRQVYLDRLNGTGRLEIITMTDIASAHTDGDEVVLELVDRKTGGHRELRVDLVLLGTGFRPQMPKLVRDLADRLGLPRIDVTREYRLIVDEPADATCHLQGVNEATHGIADSLLSVLAVRAEHILRDILRVRAARPRLAAADESVAGTSITAAAISGTANLEESVDDDSAGDPETFAVVS
ncbi:MAG: SidA/IucD/PvdA family monooxygenase [Sciscionella sp.]|nr:SidA/IucD/PvdA family monooxygenase [Sciscionella sp.]